MSRVVVTGGTGFIGRRLVARLLEKGATVRLATRDVAAAKVQWPSVEVASWDATRDPDPAVLEGADVVLHLASRVPPNMADPSEAERCLEVNALGTLRLLTAAAAARVPRVVHFSTGNMYAPRAGLLAEQSAIFPCRRGVYYFSSKACAEFYAEHFRTNGELRTATLRIAAVYGPGMPSSTAIVRLARSLRFGEPAALSDGGRYAADLVHVDDVVEAAVLSAESQHDGIFNVASGVLASLRDVLSSLERIEGRTATNVKIEAPAATAPTGFSALDISRIRDLLGYRPRSLDDGLRSLMASLAPEAGKGA